MKNQLKVLAICLLISLCSVACSKAKENQSSQAAQTAADFTLNDTEGAEVSLSDYQGKRVIVVFWTTWCPYCRQALTSLKGRYQELSAKGLQVLAVNVGESTAQVQRYAQTQTMPFPMLMDKDKAVAYEYNVVGVPAYVLVDESGSIIYNGNYLPDKYLTAQEE